MAEIFTKWTMTKIFVHFGKIFTWRAARAAAAQGGLLSAAVAPHGEPQLLRHFGAQTLSETVNITTFCFKSPAAPRPVVHGILAAVPAELEDGDHDGEGEAAQQHHEHPADVLHTQRVSLRVLALVLNTAAG